MMGSSPILPALPEGQGPHDSGFSRTESGRLVRVETHLYYVSKQVEAVHKDLQESVRVLTVNHNTQQERLEDVEKRTGTIETHLGWMKGIWAAVQASVIGWLGFK